jgi:hypothetical protein
MSNDGLLGRPSFDLTQSLLKHRSGRYALLSINPIQPVYCEGNRKMSFDSIIEHLDNEQELYPCEDTSIPADIEDTDDAA